MKWFEHDSNASINKKLKPIIQQYGVEGYGLYFYCVELVARELHPTNTECAITWDAETLSIDLKMTAERVKEILKALCDRGLFEKDGNKITCPKIMDRLDASTSQNPSIKRILKKFKGLKDV